MVKTTAEFLTTGFFRSSTLLRKFLNLSAYKNSKKLLLQCTSALQEEPGPSVYFLTRAGAETSGSFLCEKSAVNTKGARGMSGATEILYA
jgi:hypothetical protein